MILFVFVCFYNVILCLNNTLSWVREFRGRVGWNRTSWSVSPWSLCQNRPAGVSAHRSKREKETNDKQLKKKKEKKKKTPLQWTQSSRTSRRMSSMWLRWISSSRFTFSSSFVVSSMRFFSRVRSRLPLSPSWRWSFSSITFNFSYSNRLNH